MVYPTSRGVTTDEIDQKAHDFIVANGTGYPVEGMEFFPNLLCLNHTSRDLVWET